MEPKTLGQLELEVLKIVWDKQGCTFPEAAEVLAKQKGYARTTILTVIQRLHKKGFLSRKKEGGVFHYYPTEKRTTVLGNLAKQFVENIFEDGEWAILEWKDPLGLRGCGFFHIVDGKIKLQRGYWDKLSFLKQHNLPISTK